MKLTTVLLIINLMSLSAISFPQARKINLNLENAPLKEAFALIEKQSEYRFLYNEKSIENQFISIDLKAEEIEKALAALLKKSGNEYLLLENNLVVIAPSNQLIKNKQLSISGKVTDKNGQTLPGVNIVEKGTQNGTITDFNGNYEIAVSGPEAVLVFSSIGYLPAEVPVADKTEINMVMEEDVLQLDEVVVVGYGTQRKTDVTGAIVSITNEELTSRPVNNILEAIQGNAAGVDITTNERPGELGSISIRGIRSLSASPDPLYVVDGIPLMSRSGIETINPHDIQSIDILKDASATAIYGSRGANGVVLVTTKRGTSGRLTLNYSGAVTTQKMVWRSEFMDAAQYIDFIRWGAYNRNPVSGTNPNGLTPGNQPSLENDNKIELFTADPVAWANIQRGWETGTWDPSRIQTFDWMGEVTQPNITHEHTLSASGGTENMKAYGSIGYLDNQGTTKGQEFQRYTVKTSIDLTPKKWFQFGANVNATYMFQDYGMSDAGASMRTGSSLIASAAKIYPYALPYDSEGNLVTFPGGQSRVANVVDEWKYSTNQRETLRIMGTLYAQAEIFKGLKYRINFGPDYRNYQNGIYNDGRSVTRGGPSFASYATNNDFSWTLDNLLYYDKTIEAHKIGVTLLQTASSWNQVNSYMDAQNIATSTELWHALGTVSSLDHWSTGLTERRLLSYMGRLNYNLADKYLVTVSGRWDGATQLADGHKWSFFPSAALGWRMDQEPFMKDINWINLLKLRLGYGSTGNAAVRPYNTKGEIDAIQFPFGNSINTGYITTDTVSNPELGWERTIQYNTGVDFTFYQGRISGSIDLYTSRTHDLIMAVALPSVSGYKATYANIGKTKNTGVDISIHSVNVKMNDFTWESRFNAAWQKDEVVELMNGKEDMIGSGSNGGWFIGKSIESVYSFERLGLWTDSQEDLEEIARFNANGHDFQPGNVKVADQNDDYQITPNEDQKIIANRRPRWTLGINNNFSYKNWQLSVIIVGRLKYDADVSEALTGMFGDQRVLDYWTPDNIGAEYQKPFRDEGGGDPYALTYFKDNSYLKLRNISLGYQFPKNMVSKAGMDNLTLYVQAQNPGMLWSNIKFRDGEYGTLHYNRGFVFGVNIGF
ncbi:MAG: SusC/RagA family TonB-linked outer membrane protein [Bacteroidales bacterium]|nr:SusC/RagA family TonB-linked outer membrane protein [Bacteroidales bacterium]